MTKELIKEPIVEKCNGCVEMILDPANYVCKRYTIPAAQWRRGNCPMASHVKKEITIPAKLNPLKASKRGIKGG